VAEDRSGQETPGRVSGGNARQDDAPGVPQSGPDDAEHKERRGSDFFREKQYPEAEELYREAVRLEPENARFHNDLATALFAQHKSDEAEAAEREALRLDPGNAEYCDNLGEYLLAQEKYTQAEAAYRDAVSLEPRNAKYLNDLGRSLFPQKRYDEAEDVQRKAIAIASDLADGQTLDHVIVSQFYNNLGDALFNQKQFDEAEAAYRKACQIDPRSARNHNDFGATLFSRKKYQEAETELQAAVARAPGNALFQNNLGDALFALERYQSAEEACRRAVSLDPAKDIYHHDLGTVLFKLERYAEAEAEYREAMRLNPASARYPHSLSLFLLAQRRYDDAEAAAREAMRLDPEKAKYRDDLVNILVASAQYASAHEELATAESALREAVLLSPADARYHNDLATVLLLTGRYDEAEAEQHAAVRLDPGRACYHGNLGVILFAWARSAGPDAADSGSADPDGSPEGAATGTPDPGRPNLLSRAQTALLEATRLDSVNAEYQNSLSAVFFAQNNYPAAEGPLRKAVRLDEGNAAYLSNLAHVLFAQQRFEEAEDAYRQVLRLDQSNSRHHDYLADALFAQRKLSSAETEYQRAIELAGASASAAFYQSHLAAVLSAEGKYADAAALLKLAIERDPANADYHDSLAAAHYHLRSYQEAEREELAAIGTATSTAQTATFRLNLARILIHQSRVAEAEQELSRLDELQVNNAPYYSLLGSIMERYGKREEAEANYRRSLALDPSVSVRCNLGILLARNHMFNEAAEESYQALEDAPTSWMPHYSLALLALEQADEYHDNSYYDDAAQHLKQAMDALITHGSPAAQAEIRATLHLNLGYAHGKLGQSSRALAEFRQAKRISRQHSRTWFAADANIRRYRLRQQTATSQRTQAAVFMTLGLAVIVTIALLEWKNRLTGPYLVSLFAVVVALFVIAFYLPIVTSIKLGPVSLDKQAIGLRSEPPEPIPTARNSPDTSLEEWASSELSQVMGRGQELFTTPPSPAATEPQPTPQETPPQPQPFGARLSGAST
jgi:Flp pilus assembly protein TadD